MYWLVSRGRLSDRFRPASIDLGDSSGLTSLGCCGCCTALGTIGTSICCLRDNESFRATEISVADAGDDFRGFG